VSTPAAVCLNEVLDSRTSCNFLETIVRGSDTIDSITSQVLRSNAF
jgi:hypothetical protein